MNEERTPSPLPAATDPPDDPTHSGGRRSVVSSTGKESAIKSNVLEVFDEEIRIAEDADAVAAGIDGLSHGEIAEKYRFLARRYRSLLRQAIKITGIGDATQNRLMRIQTELDRQNEELATKNEELDRKNAELTKQRQEAMWAREEALAASRTKSTFLANMSHELRTPLNGILGFVQLLNRDRNLTGEQREYLNIIMRSGEHLLGLINDVLSISKIEAGQAALNLVSFDLHQLVLGVEELFYLRAREKRLAWTVDIAQSLPQCVYGDEGKVRQVLINLLGNAFKFTESGAVRLRVEWAEGGCLFEVSDTGSGIAPEEMSKLFQAFVQTATGQKANEGTGLGLAISRSFVQLMGGDIAVTSEEGRGTTFRFKVPLEVVDHLTQRVKPRKPIALVPSSRNYRILIVEDRLENRVLLSKLLSSVGFEVREANNGYEAIAVWNEWRPDLIWMDMRMPVMDGYEATRAIRRAEALGSRTGQPDMVCTYSPCRIIALSASAFDLDREGILEAGCDDFVAKPFREEAIFEKMAQYLDVRYTYEGDPVKPEGDRPAVMRRAVLTPQRLEGLGTELLDQLHKAVVAGDLEKAALAAEVVHRHDPILGAELKALIRTYRLDDILDVIESVG